MKKYNSWIRYRLRFEFLENEYPLILCKYKEMNKSTGSGVSQLGLWRNEHSNFLKCSSKVNNDTKTKKNNIVSKHTYKL